MCVRVCVCVSLSTCFLVLSPSEEVCLVPGSSSGEQYSGLTSRELFLGGWLLSTGPHMYRVVCVCVRACVRACMRVCVCVTEVKLYLHSAGLTPPTVRPLRTRSGWWRGSGGWWRGGSPPHTGSAARCPRGYRCPTTSLHAV